MTAPPIISIITPVFNGEKYIEETIRSVLDARIDLEYEYLVLNDGSTDSTLKIIRKFEDKVKVYSHENIGESETVNRGIQYATGEYLLVLSADDPLLTKDLLSKASIELNSNINLVAVYPDWKIISSNGQDLEFVILPEYSDEIMIGQNRCLPGPGVVFRRDAALKIGGRRKIWKFVGDYDFWLRLSRLGSIQRLPGILAQWRDSADSTSISQRGALMASERIRVIESFLLENNLEAKLQRIAKSNSFMLAARLNFFDPDIKGRALLFKSFITRRGWPETAQFSVVLYLLLTPISRIVLELFPKVKLKISNR
jgi:glycosyltransferase involved in cell wall biosynthesis